MPLHLYYRPSFKRSLERLGYEQKRVVGLILESLTQAFDLLSANSLKNHKTH